MGERLVDVYVASGEAEANIIKGKLEANGIPCIFKSDSAMSVHVFTVNGMGQVKIAVNESMAEDARRLLEEDFHSIEGWEEVAE